MQDKSKDSVGTKFGIDLITKATGKKPTLARGRAKYLTWSGLKMRITEASFNQRGKNWCFSLGDEKDDAVLAIGEGSQDDGVTTTAWLIPRKEIDASGSFFIRDQDPKYARYIIPQDVNLVDAKTVRAVLGLRSPLLEAAPKIFRRAEPMVPVPQVEALPPESTGSNIEAGYDILDSPAIENRDYSKMNIARVGVYESPFIPEAYKKINIDMFYMYWPEVYEGPTVVGVDFARSLQYANPSEKIRELPEYCKIRITKAYVRDVGLSGILFKDNRVSTITLLNEEGMYTLMANSMLPGGELFRHWVFGEVLPAIRKEGYYVSKTRTPSNVSESASIGALPGTFSKWVDDLAATGVNVTISQVTLNFSTRKQ